MDGIVLITKSEITLTRQQRRNFKERALYQSIDGTIDEEIIQERIENYNQDENRIERYNIDIIEKYVKITIYVEWNKPLHPKSINPERRRMQISDKKYIYTDFKKKEHEHLNKERLWNVVFNDVFQSQEEYLCKKQYYIKTTKPPIPDYDVSTKLKFYNEADYIRKETNYLKQINEERRIEEEKEKENKYRYEWNKARTRTR